jgi:hypothetical protein
MTIGSAKHIADGSKEGAVPAQEDDEVRRGEGDPQDTPRVIISLSLLRANAYSQRTP